MCPTCRSPFTAAEIAHVDSRPQQPDSQDGSEGGDEEAAIVVSGSSSTKVRCCRHVAVTPQSAMLTLLLLMMHVYQLQPWSSMCAAGGSGAPPAVPDSAGPWRQGDVLPLQLHVQPWRVCCCGSAWLLT